MTFKSDGIIFHRSFWSRSTLSLILNPYKSRSRRGRCISISLDTKGRFPQFSFPPAPPPPTTIQSAICMHGICNTPLCIAARRSRNGPMKLASEYLISFQGKLVIHTPISEILTESYPSYPFISLSKIR